MATFWAHLSGPFAHALRGTGDRAPNNVLGILAMLAATAVFVTGDSIMKIMSQRMPTGETMFIRGVIGTALMWTMLWRFDMLDEVRRHLNRLIGWRTAAEVGASGLFQSGLTRLPFAEVGAIGQVNPLLVTAAAAFFLGEKVGWRRWTATAVGLVGALLIIRPGGATFHWASLLILGSVFFSVSRDMITRRMEPGFSPFVLAGFSAVAIGLSSLLFLPFESWVWPAPLDVFWLAFPAILMMIGQTLVVVSIRAGDVSAVVPFRYAAMLWSLTYSYLIWREIPDVLTFVGIAIVCSAGLYTFHREQVRRREELKRLPSSTGAPSASLSTEPHAAEQAMAMLRQLAGGVRRLVAMISSPDPHSASKSVVIGVGAMVAAMMCFNTGDTVFKVMGSGMPVGEMLFIRGIFATVAMLGFCAYVGVLTEARRLLTPLIGLRVSMEALCSVLFFVGLMHLNYADAVAIGQFTPLMVMAGAALFLGEPVGWRRWTAAGFGFLGVLLIIKPGTSAFQPMAVIILLSVVSVAARDLATRLVPKTTPTSLLTAASALSGMVVGLAMAPFERAWHWPSLSEVLVLAFCAGTVLGGYIFIIIAMRIGPTAVTAPFRYTSMLFATFSSLVIFRERPDAWSWFGIALIIGAGLYMLHRERVVLQRGRAAVAKATAG